MDHVVALAGTGPVDVALAAEVARDYRAMIQAYRLAQWVGDVRRPVTVGGVLRRPDVGATATAIGVAVPDRVRTAADVPALHRPWCVAVGIGLLTVDAGTVAAGPALDIWPTIDPVVLLDGWLAGLRAACAAESDRSRPQSVVLLVSIVLRILATDAASVGDDLQYQVGSVMREHPEMYDRFTTPPSTGSSTRVPAAWVGCSTYWTCSAW